MKTPANHLAALAFFGLVALAPAAGAQDLSASRGPNDPLSVRITYADLNVESDAGMQTLTQRVDGAVRRVCPISHRGTRLDEIGACRLEARRNAWEQFAQNQERARARRSVETAAIPNPRPAF